jgi:hypothetical protein
MGIHIQGVGSVEVGAIAVFNPTGRAIHDASAAHVKIGTVTAVDERPTPTMTHAFQSTGRSSGRIDVINTNLSHDSSHPCVSLAAGQYGFEIGQIRLASQNVTAGVVELTRGRSETSVACDVWCAYVGGVCDYFRPVIEMVPLNDSVGSNDLYYLVSDRAGDMGFIIVHPHVHECPEKEPPRIKWNVACWKVTPEPLQAAAAE